jgi:uncharacterized protein YdcH (DUF465 family)
MSSTLKIPKEKFLARLIERRNEYDASVKREEDSRETFKKLETAYILKVLKAAIKDPKLISNRAVHRNGEVNIYFASMPDYPVFNFDEERINSWEYRELCNVINLVELSDGEFVPATIHKNAMRFL